MVSRKLTTVKLSEISSLYNKKKIPQPHTKTKEGIQTLPLVSTGDSSSGKPALPIIERDGYFKITFKESHDPKYNIKSIHDKNISDENKIKMKAAIADFMEYTVGKPITEVNSKEYGLRRIDDPNDAYTDLSQIKHQLKHFSCYPPSRRNEFGKKVNGIRIHGYYIGSNFIVVYVDWYHRRHKK